MRRALAFLLFVLGWALPGAARAMDYEVGPGQAYSAIGEVPWESLGPGDRVRIHWRDTPYREKWVLGVAGTADEPIVVRGVPGPGGALPVIDGEDATTRTALNFWSEGRGVLKVGGSSVPGETPAHVVIEGLEIRNAHVDASFTDHEGDVQDYPDNAASIFIESGAQITIRGCELHGSGNGLFVAHAARDVTVEGNHIHGNGNAGSTLEHNSYTEALGITFQHNHYGPLREGAGGNNLKDRSAGTVVRYNWIEGGNRQLDLVDSGYAAIRDDPSYRETFVYGNVLVEPDGAGNRQIVHYGGEGDTSDDRNGTLHFFHNTVVSMRTGRTSLVRLSSDGEQADVRNNIVYVEAGGSSLEVGTEAGGSLTLSHNWLPEGWVDHFVASGTEVTDDGTNVTGTDPGFEDLGAWDLHPASDSPCLDAGGALASEALSAHEPERQYVRHGVTEPRPDDGMPDLGALEACPAEGCTPPVVDGGRPGGDGGGEMSDGGGPGGGSGGSSSGGCAVGRDGGSSGQLPAVLLMAVALIGWRRRRRGGSGFG